MNEAAMLCGVESKKILQTVIDKRVPAIMSYSSKGKWHAAKVLPTNLGQNGLYVESADSGKQRPINIQVNQPVGISFKHEYGKYVFDTTVVALEPSSEPEADRARGGTIILAVPDKIEVIQRRSYFRVNVPESLKVKVLLWHRSNNLTQCTVIRTTDGQQAPSNEPIKYYQGKLVDISAGGAQVMIPYEGSSSRKDFKKGQFIGMRFTPMPYEMPLMLSAQVRNLLPTADGKSTALGLQFVGLEASTEGRRILARLIGVVERYYQANQINIKQQDVFFAPETI